MDKEIDARGLACPQPVVMAKKALDEMEEGSVTAIVDSDTAVENLTRLAESMGTEPEIKREGNTAYITIHKAKAQTEPEEASCTFSWPEEKNLVIMVSTDLFGKGDEELGRLLMKNYIYTLTQTDEKPETLIFINRGVFLTTEGSASIDDLKKLEESGIEILSCGTCLDFYGVKDKLKVGSVSNMYTIVEKMNGATNTITI
ncbi:MAG: sulfurtransferase-like selenium metabolism protein YedF [Thermoanaerobacteraceae bacterium]|nr:sulfurtransferase-like selenium metabolism protein YedF [Thermoanaerobacteraceae bacterium]